MKKSVMLLVAAGLFSGPLYADSQAVYETHCKACHQAGLGGAPKPGDKAAWGPRIAKGVDVMLATVKSGKGAMPKQGTCVSCDDEALKSVIQIFIGQAK